MPMFRPRIVVLAAAFAMASLSPGFADRDPTPEERSAIEQALRAAGFTAWEEIELDDDMWEVDDARGNDGRIYDLKLAPGSFEIIRRIED